VRTENAEEIDHPMAKEHLKAQARRVVTGKDAQGRSTIVVDENTPVRVATDGYTVCRVWEAERLPTNPALNPAADGGTLSGTDRLTDVLPEYSPSGLAIDVDTFPPDSEVDFEAIWGPTGETGIPGYHGQPNEVAVVIVVSGEITAVMEGGEAVLRPGDSIIRRDTQLAWNNRGDTPATVIAIKLSAES
jgi:hypothetical protein